MFASIAPRYDLANRVLSMRVDVRWRRHAARHLLEQPGLVLDVAAGTGDLSIDLRRYGGHRVIPSDFTVEMLVAGRSKIRRALGSVALAADALRLPFSEGRFDGVTVAFGIRNFCDPVQGLREMVRVTRPGGAVGILEFSKPTFALDRLYHVYFRRLLPAVGGAVTGSRDSYSYLAESVATFPEGPAFAELMTAAGLVRLSLERLTGGIVTFYRGERA